jgi:hypothetical protein
MLDDYLEPEESRLLCFEEYLDYMEELEERELTSDELDEAQDLYEARMFGEKNRRYLA